jgi:hypothetical protein
MYGHALTLLALLEVCGNMPWRSDLDDKIAKAVQALLTCQHPDGGWRYEFANTGDSNIAGTTVMLWALGQARKCGYAVPKNCTQRALGFVERCGFPNGEFAFRLNGRTRIQPHSGVGVAALFGSGLPDHRLVPAARNAVVQEFKRYSVEDLAARTDLMSGAFFASLALYSGGYDCWSAWYSKFQQIEIRLQQANGAILDEQGCTTYPTALAAIILQAPYAYLSIYVQ